MFGGSDFATALTYAVVIIINSQSPAQATAVHGGKVVKRGHQRYYGTMRSELDWFFYRSTSPETRESIARINRIHARIWGWKIGTFASSWEGQMTIIGQSYFDTWVRRVVGARNQKPHPKVQAAYPLWGEQITACFQLDPGGNARTMGINYPRTWSELEEFFYWLEEYPFELQTSSADRQTGHDCAESFIKQFCELWFPRCVNAIS